MKKLVLLFTAAATISMISCGNAEKAAQATDSTATDSTELVQADTISAEDFQAQLDELVARTLPASRLFWRKAKPQSNSMPISLTTRQ